MEHLITPAGYKPVLDLRETQVAIKEIKDFFQRELAKQLNLTVCPHRFLYCRNLV